MIRHLFLTLIFLFFMLSNASALSFKNSADHLHLTVIPQYRELTATTENITFLTVAEIKPNWHVYWQNPGDTGDPTTLIFYDSPYYYEFETIRSIPEKSVFNDIITTYVHHRKFYIKTTFNIKHLPKSNKLPFNLIFSYTACQKECLPELITLNFALPITETATLNPEFEQNLIDAENTFPLPLEATASIFAENLKITLNHELENCEQPEFISLFPKKNILSDLPKTQKISPDNLQITFDTNEIPDDLSGLILCNQYAYNITPKNIPVPPSPAIPENLLYYIISAFIAGLILNLMPCVLPIIGLKALYLVANSQKASISSALIYLSGVLTSFILLAGGITFFNHIGANLGWGFQLQSPWFNGFLFLLFLLIFLNLIDKLPLSGKFTDKFQKLAGSGSFLTGFFAVLIACPCTGPFMGAAVGFGLREPPLITLAVFISLGLGYALPYVLIESFPQFFLKFIPKPGRWMITLKHLLSVPIALTCLWLLWVTYSQLRPQSNQDELWTPYNRQKVEQSLNHGDAVLIDFTAKWCLTCLLNDKAALDTEEFKQIIKQNHIQLFKADWTNHNQEIADALQSYGRKSIPLYVYYKKGSHIPEFLPQILTPDILLNTLKP